MSEFDAPIGEAVADAEAELSIEDFYQSGIDNEKLKKEEKELLLPVGTYTTTPPFEPKLEKDKTGRPVARFWGSVTFGEVTGKIGYRMSPVRVNKKDKDGNDTGKPDNAYKLYLQAVKAYGIAAGAPAENVGQVIAFLRDYAHRIRVIQTESGENFVVSISAIRPEA